MGPSELHSGSKMAPSQPIVYIQSHLGTIFDPFGLKLTPSWPQVGLKLASSWLKLAWLQDSPRRPQVASRWLKMASRCLKLPPSWPQVGLKLAPSWLQGGHLGASWSTLGPSRSHLDQLCSILVAFWSFWIHFGSILDPFWTHFGSIVDLFWNQF